MSNRSSLRKKTRTTRVDVSPGDRGDRSVAIVRATECANISQPGLRASPQSTPLVPASVREDMIRETAYFLAQARGFAPGAEVEDWLAAEQEVDEVILRRYAS